MSFHGLEFSRMTPASPRKIVHFRFFFLSSKRMDQWLVPSWLLGALALLWLVKPDKRYAGLPSPKFTLPILGNTLDFVDFQLPRLYDWLTDECVRQDGRPWRLKLLGYNPVVVVSSVEAFEDVMKTQFDDPVGNAIVASDGEQWKAQGRVLTHMFTMRAFRDTIADTVVDHVRLLGEVLEKKMKSHEPMDFSQTCHRFTYDTFANVGFGIESHTLTNEHDDVVSSALGSMSVGVQMRLVNPALWRLQRWLGVGAQGHMMRQIKRFDKVAYGIVHECLRHKNSSEAGDSPRKVNDIVSMFVDQYAQGSSIGQVLKIDPTFLRDTGVTMLFAGRDTTASTIEWCNLMLNKHPDKAALVREELRSVLPRLFEDPEYVPSMDDVELLIYLEAVVRETLRLNPILPLNVRQANRDTTLSDGMFIAKGTQVFFPSYTLGRMKSVWGEDSVEFKPDRWIETDATTNKKTIRNVSAFQFLAFHGGPRICIGMRFAMLELKTALAYVLSKYELKTIRDPHSFTYSTVLTLTLDSPMMIRVLPADKADAA